MNDQITGTNGVSSRLVNQFKHLGHVLTRPSESLQEPDHRHQAQLLAAFHLMLIPAVFILSLADNWLTPLQTDSTFVVLSVTTFMILIITYGFSRTRYYKLAAIAALTMICAFLFIAAILRLLPPGIGLLYYLIFPMLAISFFFSMRATVLFAGLNLIAMLLLPLYRGQEVVPTVVYGPATFIIFGLFLVFQIKQQRDWLEQDRRTQLEAKEEQLRLITDNMHDIVSHLSTDGVVQYISPSLENILGYRPERVIGHSFEQWFNRIHPDDVEQFRADLKLMLRAEYSHNSHFRVRHIDDHYVWLEGISNPLRGPGNRPNGIILVTRDVTERQLVDQALLASEAKFRAVAETIDASIMLIQGEDVVYSNPGAEKLTGYSREELRSMNLLDLIHPDQRTVIGDRFYSRLRGESQPAQYEAKIVTKAGETRWNLLSVTLMEYQGNPTILSTAIDITRSKHAEEQQLELALERQKVRLLRRFLGDLSHDLSNPLAAIGTSLYVLKNSDTPEKRQRHIDIIAQQAAHLEKVVQDLLSIARLENSSDTFDFLPVDMNDLLQTLLKEQQPAAAEKKLNLQLTMEGGQQAIIGDEAQLRRAIGHLLTNALTFTPEGGSIQMQAKTSDGGLQIDVIDNGVGIAPEDLPYIFDHFYRGDKARNTSTGGAGLGLTIAKRIIEAHQGKLDVESNLGAGCTFHVWLPVHETFQFSHQHQGL